MLQPVAGERRRRLPRLAAAWGLCLAGVAVGSAEVRAAGQAESARQLPGLPVTQIEGAAPQAPAVQPQPPPPLPLQPLAVTQLDERQRGLDLETGRTFSLRLADPLPVRDVLLLLVRDTSFSVVPDPDVGGTFGGELKNVTLREALDLVLHPLGLDYAVQQRFVRVFRRKTETRLFDVNYVLTRRTARRTLGAATTATGRGLAVRGAGVPTAGSPGAWAAGDGAIGGSSTEVRAADEADLFDELEAGVRGLLSERGQFNLDRKAALLQATDYPDRLDRVSLYLDAVQNRVHRQVQIQARVVEIELDEAFASGVDWAAVFRQTGDSATVTQRLAAAGPAVTLAIELKNFEGLLRALATQGRVNVLSSPRVVAMNNEPAVMRVGTQDVFFVTTSHVDATDGRVLRTTVTPHAVTEGVVLSLTPQISADGIINLSISPSVTNRTGEAVSRLGDTVPVLSVREADTLVRVYAGETIVIAGLMLDRMSTQRSKVPLLGDVPLVGGLFRREERRMGKTDLVILLTPTLLAPGQLAATPAVGDRLGGATGGSPGR